MSFFSVTANGIPAFEHMLNSIPTITRTAMSRALNDTARDVLPVIKKQIYAEVSFPTGYLDKPDRLAIAQYATETSLVARIEARDRATSLARFAMPGTPVARKGLNLRKPGGVTIVIKPGTSRTFPNAYLAELNSGNVGFAIRLKPGSDSVHGVQRYKPVELFSNQSAKSGGGRVFLLYGPSVDQVFQDVRVTLEPQIEAMLTNEFWRQFTVLNRVG